MAKNRENLTEMISGSADGEIIVWDLGERKARFGINAHPRWAEVWSTCPRWPGTLESRMLRLHADQGATKGPQALACAQEMAPHGGWAVSISPGHTWGDIHKSRADAAGLSREAYESSMPNIASTPKATTNEPIVRSK
ncbi:MAG: hypothetical protein HC805_08010 [Alkalinema sp. RL_2_19]|nr:hypothetical protein [Alkalinema sp. RL_2_19]